MSGVNCNLYHLFAERFPAAASPCIETADGVSISYGEFDTGVSRYASALTSLGVAVGDRIAVQVPKSPQALMLYLACLRAGFVYLPLNTGYTRRELDYFVADAEPAAIVCAPDEEALSAVARERAVSHLLSLDADGSGSLGELAAGASDHFQTVFRAADDLAAILYTSGTTGQPKGAMLSHRNLYSNAEALVATWAFTSDDVLLHALPLFHTHGLFVACHCALYAGARMILLPRFDAAQVASLMSRASVLMGVPTFYVRLLLLPDFGREQARSVRLFVSGSAPLLPQTFDEFKARTGHAILERYGMTETGMNTSNPLDGERRAGTVGRPLPGVEVRVTGDDGRTLPVGQVGGVELRGPNVFVGYWRNPVKTATAFTADGWFRSGDLGRIDDDGYLAIVGRGKDLIISGGFNVYPKEVELCIDQIEGVEESAVVGVPHTDFGEAVTAVVVRRARGSGTPDEAGVLAALRIQLAAYKLPKRIHFVDELPRNAMGKVQKNLIRDRLAAGASDG